MAREQALQDPAFMGLGHAQIQGVGQRVQFDPARHFPGIRWTRCSALGDIGSRCIGAAAWCEYSRQGRDAAWQSTHLMR